MMMRVFGIGMALAINMGAAAAKETGTCGLYLAETLDEMGRLTMGVFSSVDISAGSIVTQNDVVVPLVDIPIHTSPIHFDEGEFWQMWSTFIWDPLDVGGVHEGIDVKSAALGMGSLVRGNSDFANVMLSQSDFDPSGVQRGQDPTAGSFSYYPGSAVIALDDIAAGQELYFPNGYHWYLDPKDKHREATDGLSINHDRMQDYFKLYQELEKKYGPEFTSEFRSTLWSVVEQSPVDDHVRALLPSSWADASDISKHTASKGTRSVEWLKENGICIDNIRHGPSTVPHAGKGAFASRGLSAGSVIAPAPLVHIWDKTMFDMFEAHVAEDFTFKIDDAIVSKQLLINYCFGHDNSSKLFCPIGSGTGFINHSPTPNAAIRWTTQSSTNLHNEEWLNMSLNDLMDRLSVGLVIEYVALRDIEEGEEIFINYGPAWEAAWKDHIQKWAPSPGAESYISAADMNLSDETVIRTVDEQEVEPYPRSVITSCVYEYIQEEEGMFGMQNQASIRPWQPLDLGIPNYMFLRPCRILSREDYSIDGEDAKHRYTAQILNYPNMHESQVVSDDQELVVTGIPRYAISFTDFSYTTDMHQHNTFRHYMVMDDSLFPKQWMYR